MSLTPDELDRRRVELDVQGQVREILRKKVEGRKFRGRLPDGRKWEVFVDVVDDVAIRIIWTEWEAMP